MSPLVYLVTSSLKNMESSYNHQDYSDYEKRVETPSTRRKQANGNLVFVTMTCLVALIFFLDVAYHLIFIK